MESSSGGLPGQPGEGRLTEQERKLVARLLYDPTYFPVEFRSWLKSFLEAELTLTKAGKKGIGSGSGSTLKLELPAGIVIGWPTMTFPTDTLACDGTVKSRSTYAKLFAIVATQYGAGDGSTTFNLPDFRDRALYGVGSRVSIGQTDGLALGSRGGPSHHHALTADGDHQHGDAGAHQHGSSGVHQHDSMSGFFATTTFATFPQGTTATTRYAVADGWPQTAAGGSHQHPGVGDHQHPSAGFHDHQGITSGGFDQDEPSWGAIAWLITTGI